MQGAHDRPLQRLASCQTRNAASASSDCLSGLTLRQFEGLSETTDVCEVCVACAIGSTPRHGSGRVGRCEAPRAAAFVRHHAGQLFGRRRALHDVPLKRNGQFELVFDIRHHRPRLLLRYHHRMSHTGSHCSRCGGHIARRSSSAITHRWKRSVPGLKPRTSHRRPSAGNTWCSTTQRSKSSSPGLKP